MDRRNLPNRALLALLNLILLTGSAWAFGVSDKIAARVITDTANGGTTEALVVLAEQADLSPAAALPSKLEKGRFVVNTLRAVAARSQAPLRAFLDQRGVPYQSFYIVNMIKVTGNLALMQELAARSDVSRIDANPMVRASLPIPSGLDANAAPTGIEWNVTRVRAPNVWALGFRGEGRVVAGNDTGVQWDHPSFKARYRGWDGTNVDHDYNWHDATSQHSPTPIDPHGHGTFTVSQMVGDDGQGKPGWRSSRRTMDRLPQHGRQWHRFSRHLYGMLPVPDSALPSGRRSKPGRSHKSSGLH